MTIINMKVVLSTFISFSSIGSTFSGFLSRMTKLASFPGVIDPVLLSIPRTLEANDC